MPRLKPLLNPFFFLILMTHLQSEAAKLFYLEAPNAHSCHAKSLEFSNQTINEKIIFTTKTCPTSLAWNFSTKTIFYIENNHLWQQSYAQEEKAKDLGIIPNEDVNLWLDTEKAIPHIAYTVRVEDKDIKKNGDLEIFHFEGKDYPATDLTSDGLAAMAVSAELKNGKWQRIEIQPTKVEAGDTPGLSVLKSFQEKKEQGVSLATLLEESICAGPNNNINCNNEDKNIAKLLGKQEGYGTLQSAEGNTFAFATIFGDTLHAKSPVYFCKGSCLQGEKLKGIGSEPISLSIKENYLLIATEYQNDSPRIYDTTNGKLIRSLATAHSAVWLPK